MIGKKLGTGRTAEVYEWTEEKVIKLFYPSVSLEEAEREYLVQTMLLEELPFLAEVYGLQQVEDRIGIVYERVHGENLAAEIFRNTKRSFTYGQILGRTHREIHKVSLPRLPSLKAYVRSILSGSVHLKEGEKEILLEILSDLPHGETVCHMDYHPENIYLSGERVTVLDWMTAVKGHPLGDVARTEMILKYAVLPSASLEERRKVDAVREALLIGYHEAYFPQGASVEEALQLKSWEMVLLAARLSEHLSSEEAYLTEHALFRRLKETLPSP